MPLPYVEVEEVLAGVEPDALWEVMLAVEGDLGSLVLTQQAIDVAVPFADRDVEVARCLDLETVASVDRIDLRYGIRPDDVVHHRLEVVEHNGGLLVPVSLHTHATLLLHDAAEVSRAGIPTVMMFVQSLKGISHNKIEDTREEHLEMSVVALDRLASKTMDWILRQR